MSPLVIMGQIIILIILITATSYYIHTATLYHQPQIYLQLEETGLRYGRPLEKMTAMMMYWKEETNRIVVTS